MSGRITIDELSKDLADKINNIGEQELLTNEKEITKAINELFTSANSGKVSVATAIGSPAQATDTFSKLANDVITAKSNLATSIQAKLDLASGYVPPDLGDAMATDVLTGKTFSSISGERIPGTMPNRSGWGINGTIQGSGVPDITIPQGYHDGTKSVRMAVDAILAPKIQAGQIIAGMTGTFTNDATATNEQILNGQTAYVNGNKITGTMPNRGAITITPGTTNQVITAGYHNGSGVVQGSVNLTAANIKSGVNIFGVTGNLISGGGIKSRQQVNTNASGFTLTDESIGFKYKDVTISSVNVTNSVATIQLGGQSYKQSSRYYGHFFCRLINSTTVRIFMESGGSADSSNKFAIEVYEFEGVKSIQQGERNWSYNFPNITISSVIPSKCLVIFEPITSSFNYGFVDYYILNSTSLTVSYTNSLTNMYIKWAVIEFI